ncbi:YHYH domain-containing protein [Cupriavidus necator]
MTRKNARKQRVLPVTWRHLWGVWAIRPHVLWSGSRHRTGIPNGRRKMKKLATGIMALALFAAVGAANAHSGGTDRQGCHVDHSTGIRHCH